VAALSIMQTHAERYALTDDGLTRYVQDFYSYRLNAMAERLTPGHHVNALRPEGLAEGGYLGFVELQYCPYALCP